MKTKLEQLIEETANFPEISLAGRCHELALGAKIEYDQLQSKLDYLKNEAIKVCDRHSVIIHHSKNEDYE